MPHIQFDTAMSAATAYYPTNGVGGYDTGTIADSLVNDWAETELLTLSVPGSASGAQIIEIHHADDTIAFTTTVLAQELPWTISWSPGNGPIVRGSWWVEFPSVASATDFWFVQFSKIA